MLEGAVVVWILHLVGLVAGVAFHPSATVFCQAVVAVALQSQTTQEQVNERDGKRCKKEAKIIKKRR